MGNHRAERRGPRRAGSSTADAPRTAGGKRAARPAPRRSPVPELEATEAHPVDESPEIVRSPETAAPVLAALADDAAREALVPTTPAPQTVLPSVAAAGRRLRSEVSFEDTTLTLPAVAAEASPATTYDVRGFAAQARADRRAGTSATAGRRKAVRTREAAAPSGLRLPIRPSAPVLAGVAVLAISAGGAVTAGGTGPLAEVDPTSYRLAASNAMSGTTVESSSDLLTERTRAVSRDSERDALEDAADDATIAETEAQAERRSTQLQALATSAEQEAQRVAENAWVLPVDNYRLTNRFGQAEAYYASGYHTGLDFAAPSGTPIRAVAGGRVSETGYAGSYGNKTVITLEDGTEMWYAHQSSISVSSGAEVAAGDVIGYVGSTGNSSGPHLHLEVRPGAGDPVDPFAALVQNGVTP
ncbi:M23 family metallopeptidase [Nocardioides sp. CPCC 205120]|uniref:M23 family metallopeptidase n=1 Tax=Nocardioides sp. CPCC 205120 TaxID=3406462 RepID=UPI003B5137A8